MKVVWVCVVIRVNPVRSTNWGTKVVWVCVVFHVNPGRSTDWGIMLSVGVFSHDWKVASSNPSSSGRRIFFSRVDFVCWLLSGVRFTSMLPQWHIKDPGHSAKSAGGWLHLNTHTPLIQRSWSGLTMPLCRHSVGTYPERSSHATGQGTLSHSRLCSLSHCRLTLAWRVAFRCAV